MAWTTKEKELIAVGISVAAGCKPCTDHHVRAVREAGATDAEIQQAMADAIAVRKSATSVMEGYVRRHFGHGGDVADETVDTARTPTRVLLAVGAAFAVNCTTSLGEHLETARHMGITGGEVRVVAKLATFIKGKGDEHVRAMVAHKREKAHAN